VALPPPGPDSQVSSRAEPGAKSARQRLLEATLQCASERGYLNFGVRHIVSSARTSRATFYTHFDDKADCFTQAYAAATEYFADRIFAAAGAAPEWRLGVRTGLAELLDLVASDPVVARAVLIEPEAAGGRVQEHYRELASRFAAAFDAGRGEALPHRPPQAGSYVVGGIREVVVAQLRSGASERWADLLPGLLQFALLPYFGEQVAWEEFRNASEAVEEGGEQ
jgi:AcrR family transcriptional regulator